MKSIQKLLADWQRERGIKPNDDLRLRYFGFPGAMTRRKMMERKCDTCIHRKADGCEKWECEYKERKGGLISRQEAVEEINRNAYRHTYIEQIIDIIENLPSAEPERKTGGWVPKDLDNFRKYEVVCSECGSRYIGNYDAYDEPYDFNYCPNCGADMRGEE